ncbi:MAG: TIGR01906 family membrane protein [Chloroflexi bacterium]|nr:TIGR01906 family membrane protein [Chloroflexota bacterium]
MTTNTEATTLSEEDVKPLLMPQWLQTILQGIIILTVPFVLVLGSVRLAMTEQFLALEYQRPGFPADPYGFSTADRLEYGPYGIEYILSNEDISFLGDLEIDSEPAFNPRELDHMEDVQTVTRIAIQVLMLTGGLFVLSIILLIRKPETRPLVFESLRRGAYFTFAMIAILVVGVVLNWNYFFTQFHNTFFAEGTWQFSRSDTLIRLYPEQFWQDAALFIGGVTILGAALFIVSPAIWQRFEASPDA